MADVAGVAGAAGAAGVPGVASVAGVAGVAGESALILLDQVRISRCLQDSLSSLRFIKRIVIDEPEGEDPDGVIRLFHLETKVISYNEKNYLE